MLIYLPVTSRPLSFHISLLWYTARGSCKNAVLRRVLREVFFQRETKGGGKLREGGGEHTIKPLPKNGFGPPTYDTIPPPLCSRSVILLRGNGHRPDKSHFLRPPKVVLEGALYSTFPPPPKIARYVLPPPICEFPFLGSHRPLNGPF